MTNFWKMTFGIFIHTCFLVHREDTGELVYTIPVGGSNDVGVWGYINAFQELLDQVNFYWVNIIFH